MRKIILLTSLLFIGAAIGAYYLISQDETRLNEAQIRETFLCDRVTADEKATDIYCDNPEYYYEDAKNGTIIGPSDFGDPRYKAMYIN